MQKSPNDPKEYRYLTLSNQLRVLLVHDAHASRSAASLSVEVGHFNDPIDRQGMAHFLEHMLFLGTEKYPLIGEFQRFITEQGGTHNAWTGTENTTYFFDVGVDAYDEALARFSQFFTAPLFNEEAIEKERQAVDSEYKLKIKDDIRRIYQVHKETINPAHPFSKFSVGDHTTLADRNGISVRDELIDFYQAHYSAERMGLVLVSSQSLETLELWANQYFAQIPTAETTITTTPIPLLLPEQQGQWITIEPLKETRKLTLSFLLPSVDAYYAKKPLSYLANLLGNEGAGSLLSILKKKNWINTLSSGGGVIGSDFREFTISVTLTTDGMAHTDDIIACIFEFLHLIDQEGLNAWRYAERKSVINLAFLNQEKSRPLEVANHLVMNVLHYRPEHIVCGDYLMNEFDESLIRQLLAFFTPKLMRVTQVAKGLHYDKKAQWYDTPYSYQAFTHEQMTLWQNALTGKTYDYSCQLPLENIFLSTRLDPHPLSSEAILPPMLIQELPGFRLWYKQDHEFRVPKGMVYIAIDSPHAVSSARNIVKTRLCVELLLESINEQAYPAEIAGMSYNLYTHQGGVTLKLSGFSDKQPQLLALILNQFQQRQFDEGRFDNIKAQMMRNWRNASEEKPIARLFNELTGMLQPNNPSYPVLLEALESVQFDELPMFVEAMLAELHIDTFIYGDWLKEDALEVAEQIKDAFRVTDQKYGESQRPLVHLTDCGTLRHSLITQHADSAMLMYYQSRYATPEKIALYTLANHLMSNVFFHELRTKQQLGYMLGTANLPLNRHPGLILYVQSPVASPLELSYAMDEFTNAFALVLLELTQQQWQDSKQGLHQQMSEPDTNLQSRAQRYWISIGNKDEEFNHRQKVIEALDNIKRADMVRFVVSVLKPRTANRLVLFSQGQSHQDQSPLTLGTKISSIDDFMKHAY